MSITSASQTQSSSQCYKQEQQPDVKSLASLLNNQIDPCTASNIVSKLAVCYKSAKNQIQDQCMVIIVKLLNKGYGKEITKNNTLLQSMMDKFCVQSKEVQPGCQLGYKLMYILSTFAELIKEAPPATLCIKKKFIQSLLLIDFEILEVSPVKKDILAVLGVLYEYISRQVRILKKFQLLKQFKRAILANYSLIEQQFSNRLFNKALYNLATQGESITQAQLSKYGVFRTLVKLMGENQASILIQKLQSALNKLNLQKVAKLQTKRSQMVAES